jgi:exopolysaccharide biosynthesis polyprenyl glycosylphosphotransferase
MKRKKLELTITTILYLLSAFLSSVLAIGLLKNAAKLTKEFLAGNTWVSAIFPVMAAEMIAMILALYDGRYAFERLPAYKYAIKSLKATIYFSGIWAVILLIEKNDITASRHYFVLTILFHFIILAVLLGLMQRFIMNHFYQTTAASLVGVVTTSGRAAGITDLLKKDWSRRLVGLMLVNETKDSVTEGVEPREIDHVPVVADASSLVEWVRSSAMDEIFIIVPDNQDPLITEAVENFIQMGISVHLNLSSIEHLEHRIARKTKKYVPKTTCRLAYLGSIPMMIMEQPMIKLRWLAAKRIMDILGGLVGSLIAMILFVFIGIAIKLDSPGPVIFAQERVGKNGRKFKMYKFRSMYQDAEARKAELMKQNEMHGLMFKIKDDPRITRVGKFIRKTSLDEFPQFFNVLKGDMSLVGTRPPTVGEFKEYSNYHKRRLSMKPGITGMWQVSGRSDIKDFEEIVRLDCEYIDNWNLWLDIKILFKTVAIVFTHKGAD